MEGSARADNNGSWQTAIAREYVVILFMALNYLPVTAELEFDCTNYETISTVLMEAIEATLAMGNEQPWSGYLGVTKSGTVVGICAFKGPPNEHREVELAWYTFPPYERRGYGTQMAAALIQFAEGRQGEVARVVVHTEPQIGPSSKICEKVGLGYQGEIEVPGDGRVWLWTKEIVAE